ncbi:protein AGENET DOMAIN (AGD)-CONTAINING P1-like [Pyrus communis]|uniref:protein AGENET DOMAIN (AGD)-CONTAINING P1-like n=1 Tax=Pyrus communis TaxID=23211 RepID=UPI0035C212D0
MIATPPLYRSVTPPLYSLLPAARVSDSQMSQTHFSKGDEVEVVTKPSRGSTGPYYPATVRRSVVKDKAHILVQYQTLTTPNAVSPRLLQEIVELGNVRPAPPRELYQFFKVGDDVDAYRENGWSRGTVTDILENSKYLVALRGEEFECEQCDLRIHRDWDDGSWVPPFQEENSSSGMVVKSRKLVLKFKCGKKPLGASFENGTVVEVSSDEEGYKDAWYTAKIIDHVGNNKYLVEYLYLVTDDGTKDPLREETWASYIRPCPPALPSVAHFKVLQKVDAWYNEGWWEGTVSKVLGGLMYVVYFSSTNEELMFEHSNLRPRQDWINGQWIPA